MIELEHVSRVYGPKVAVDGLDLSVPQGELFAFLGPNGAGKTTTIKMLVGLLRPSAGTVRICGLDRNLAVRETSQLLGYVPDEPYLYEKLTGREFLQFVAEMYGLDRVQAAGRIARETERFELADFLDELTESYSHGMKQRMVFAAALVHDPRVLVLDEPMVGLDPRSGRLTKDLMRACAKAGTTIFMSTHTLDVVEELADRIGIINHGRLCFLGTLDELRRQQQSHDRSLETLFLQITEEEGARGQGPAIRSRAVVDS